MAAGRPLFGLISLILLAGGVLLQFFIVLSGGVHGNPVSQVYFLQSSTNGIPGQRDPSRWTYWAICSENNGHNTNCGSPVPALPFDPPRNFGTEDNVPEAFVGQKRFFYLSRFAWVFYLMALIVASFALLLGLLALCTRLGAYLSGVMTFVALFFQTVAAALMTAWTVMGRNIFRNAGQDAHLGVKAYAFTWTSVACFFLSSILFCLAGRSRRDETTYATPRTRRAGFFGRKRSTRSRGSFLDNESQRRVKDEYS